jgi:hypothetical protein
MIANTILCYDIPTSEMRRVSHQDHVKGLLPKQECISTHIQVNKMLCKLNYYKLSLKFDTSKFYNGN